jgi:hypothetical protein
MAAVSRSPPRARRLAAQIGFVVSELRIHGGGPENLPSRLGRGAQHFRNLVERQSQLAVRFETDSL